MWFHEQRTPLGTWSPRTSVLRPQEISADGSRRTIRAVTELPQDQQHLSLTELARLYGKRTPVPTFTSRRHGGSL